MQHRTEHPLRPTTGRGSTSTAWLLAAVIAALAAAATGLAGHLLFHWASMTAFRTFFYATAASVVLAFAALVIFVYGMFRKRRILIYRGLLVMFLGLIPAAGIVATLGPDRLMAPVIHDVSTDTTFPPAFVVARTLRTTLDNSVDYGGKLVAAIQHLYYPGIQPVFSRLSTGKAYDRSLTLAHQFHWKLLRTDRQKGTIEATDRSRIFGFVDDIVIRVTPRTGGSRVDIRSSSRQGMGDLGANARRVMRFLRTFSKGGASGTGSAGVSPTERGR